jgi:hypothetical protein
LNSKGRAAPPLKEVRSSGMEKANRSEQSERTSQQQRKGPPMKVEKDAEVRGAGMESNAYRVNDDSAAALQGSTKPKGGGMRDADTLTKMQARARGQLARMQERKGLAAEKRRAGTCVRVQVYAHVSVYACVCVRVCVYVCVFVCTLARVCMYVCVYTFARVCMYKFVQVY